MYIPWTHVSSTEELQCLFNANFEVDRPGVKMYGERMDLVWQYILTERSTFSFSLDVGGPGPFTLFLYIDETIFF